MRHKNGDTVVSLVTAKLFARKREFDLLRRRFRRRVENANGWLRINLAPLVAVLLVPQPAGHLVAETTMHLRRAILELQVLSVGDASHRAHARFVHGELMLVRELKESRTLD